MIKKREIITLLLILLATTVQADRDSEEYRLLKSWGIQFDEQGKLRFRLDEGKTSPYHPWNPDLSAYQAIDALQARPEILKPLIISSRDRPLPEKEHNAEK